MISVQQLINHVASLKDITILFPNKSQQQKLIKESNMIMQDLKKIKQNSYSDNTNPSIRTQDQFLFSFPFTNPIFHLTSDFLSSHN